MTEELIDKYGKDVINFVIAYVIEPHPHGQICPYTGNFWLNYPANYDIDGQPLYQPDHYWWRIDQAKKMKSALLDKPGLQDIPVIVDRMDNPVWCTYGPAPNNAYFIDVDGTVIEKLGWYTRSDRYMEDAIKRYLGIPIPSARCKAVPNYGEAPLEVNFNADGSSDPDGSIVLYEWDFDGDGTFDFSSASSGSTSYTYPIVGSYDAVLRVTDDDLHTDTCMVSVTVTSNL